MSLYDDLADSAFMGKDKFRHQLQANSHLGQQLDRSQFNNFNNQYDTSDSGKVNQDENFSQFGLAEGFKDDFTNSGKTADIVRHLAHNSNLDNSAFLLQSQYPPRDTKLAKEDLFSKRTVIGHDLDDEP